MKVASRYTVCEHGATKFAAEVSEWMEVKYYFYVVV